MNEPLHIKYRPATLDEVVGHAAVLDSLEERIKNNDAHSFLFCGIAGGGKTTLARITAGLLGALPQDIIEVNAASKTGVDDMRAVMEPLQYKPFGKGKARAIIIDECHRLSANAWDSLLKSTEEPPEHVYWFFCTTDPRKVPNTIKTRCAQYTLNPIPEKDLAVLYGDVCTAEKIKLPADIGAMIVREANGSARQMLQNLAACRNVKDKKSAAQLLRTALEQDPIRELAQYLLQGGSWAKAMAIFAKFEGEDPEGVRIVICNYMAAVLRNSTKEQQAARTLNILAAFSTPYNPAERTAPLLLSIGTVLFNPD